MLPSALMSPYSFSTVPVEPFVYDDGDAVGGTMPLAKTPLAWIGAPIAWWLAKTAVIVVGGGVDAGQRDDLLRLVHAAAVSKQPASTWTRWPTNRPATLAVVQAVVVGHS